MTVWLVVVEDMGADGLLLGSFGAAVPFLAWLAIDQRRRLALVPDFALLRRLVRFGLPTMPAELSLYSLNFIDRIIIVRLAGLAEAGLYALAIKFAQAINVLVRGFQLAWPPLAYSIEDDDEARRAYSLIVTWFMAVCAFVVVGMWLLARWIVRLLAAPEFFEAYEAIGLLTRGDDAVRALPGARRRARPHGPHRVQLPRDDRRHRRQHRPQPGPRPPATGSSAPRSRSSPPTWSCWC